jgi:hypothetical protein
METHMRRNRRLTLGVIGTALLVGLVVPTAARAAQQSGTGVCDWGGTAAAPTGHLTFSPGLTNTPSTAPIHFYATGPSQGGPCSSTVTFEGWVPAGATCTVLQFDQKVEGVPGVETASGPSVATVVQEVLRNADGQVVGFNDPFVQTPQFAQQFASDPTVCSQPHGFTQAAFYSIITVFGNGSGSQG